MEMEKKYLYLIIAAYAASSFSQGIFTPVYAFFIQKIGGGIMETSWAIGVYSMVTGIGTILIHKTEWSERNRLTLLWVGWFFWLLSVAVYFIMTNIYLMYLSQVLGALGVAIEEPIFNAELSRQASSNLSRGWALFGGMTEIFTGIAAIFGGIITKYYGFEVLIHSMIAIAFVSFVMIITYIYRNRHLS
jgi:MFS family permease